MKGSVDKGLCIGCGICPDVCSEIFKMDDDGKAVGSDKEIPEDILDNALDAQSQCPVDAIDIK